MNTKSRPVHLDLIRMKFPIMAIVSVMHRASGVLLFLLLPLLFYLLHTSLQSEVTFTQLQVTLAMPEMKFLLWVLFSAVAFHFFAGIRHMLMDCGVAEALEKARVTACLVICLEVIVMIVVGVWLC